jgi:hypothetical protein
MVARNFLEVDNNILYPRIDIAGEKSGITGMEFPIMNYTIYLTSLVFGYQHWYGRLINLIISSIGIFFFFKLIRKYFNEKIAFNAALVLLTTLWFSFSRKIMPDTFAMSFIIAGIYYGSNYLDQSIKKYRITGIILYTLLITIGILSKLPSAYLLIVFLIAIFSKEITLKRKLYFSFASILAISPSLIWYFYWVPFLVDSYGFWHFFMGKNILEGMQEISDELVLTLQKFYDNALKYIGFGVFSYGLIQSIILKEKRILIVLSLSFVSFLVIIFKAGHTFPHHDYYIIPFIPVMALVTGYGIYQIKNKNIAFILLLAIGIEGTLNQHSDFIIREKEKALLSLEKDLDEISNRNDLILINSDEYPTPMYFAHRKGWVNSNQNILDEDYIKRLEKKGLKFIVILKRAFGSNIKIDHPLLIDTKNYSVYKL